MEISAQIVPNFEAFQKKYNQDIPQVIYQTIENDLETPVSVYLKTAQEKPGSFLLESVEGGEVLGRHSIIGLEPDLIWQAQAGKAALNRNALEEKSTFAPDERPPLESFQALLDESEINLPLELAPMAAGVFGYFGYDLVREREHLPNIPKGGIDIADAIFVRPTLVIILDNIRQEMSIATPVRPSNDHDAEQAYKIAIKRVQRIKDKLGNTIPHNLAHRQGQTDIESTSKIVPQSNISHETFLSMIERAKDYISAGDIFQVVLSQRFEIPFSASPFALYRSLRRENPSPFMYFLNFESHAIVGSSPEILVRVRNREVTIRPIAGTRPRGRTLEEDKALEIDLLNDPKERAEHLMLLDLGRNDVGRSTKINSVNITDSFIIERYSHVMHIVSNVTGQLREDKTPIDAMMAGFPAGTVSGAPKVRAMEIIDELEPESRKTYAGAIGYFSASGDVDTAITLRTAVIKNDKMYVQAGAGVVTDSDPQGEHQECINKARALFSAAKKVIV